MEFDVSLLLVPTPKRGGEAYIGANECVHIMGPAGNDAADETHGRSPNDEPSPAKLVRHTAKKKHGYGATTSPDNGEQAGVGIRPWNPQG
jgi:hypothetical protein